MNIESKSLTPYTSRSNSVISISMSSRELYPEAPTTNIPNSSSLYDNGP